MFIEIRNVSKPIVKLAKKKRNQENCRTVHEIRKLSWLYSTDVIINTCLTVQKYHKKPCIELAKKWQKKTLIEPYN